MAEVQGLKCIIIKILIHFIVVMAWWNLFKKNKVSDDLILENWEEKL